MSYITLDYTNYKGERRLRDVAPISIVFRSNNYYHGSGFILIAYDVEKRRTRDFAVNMIHNQEVLEGVIFAQQNWKVDWGKAEVESLKEVAAEICNAFLVDHTNQGVTEVHGELATDLKGSALKKGAIVITAKVLKIEGDLVYTANNLYRIVNWHKGFKDEI